MKRLLNVFNRGKSLKMIWEVEFRGKNSYLVGTAHIFSYSFKSFFNRLISHVENVVFEGPLDQQKMQKVIKSSIVNNSFNLYEMIEPSVLSLLVHHFTKFSLNKIIPSIREVTDRHIENYYKQEIPNILRNYRHWMAFFSLWYLFLNLIDWKNSIDLEVFQIASKSKKRVYYLETIEEQIEAMEGIPPQRIINFFKKVNLWESYAKTYEKLYLKGAWQELINHTSEFPTRCESIVDKRDPILFSRMLPFLERGDSLIVVGTTHVLGIMERLKKAGFSINLFS